MTDTPLHWVLFAVLAVVVLGTVTGGFVTTSGGPDGTDSPELVDPVANGSSLWPYTSRTRSFETRTLGINLVVRGDPDAVRGYLLRHADDDRSERRHPDDPVDGSAEAVPLVEPGVTWQLAHGGARYTYVERSDQAGGGVWIEATYQLYEGTFLGTRYHVRAYAAPGSGDDWTAMQAHEEYWDWFGLRHTVTSAKAAQRHVESDLADDPVVESVRRVNLGNAGTADGDGWAAVIEFAALAILVGGARSAAGAPGDAVGERIRGLLRATSQKRAIQWVGLVAALVLVYLGVRLGGVAAEQAFPTVSPVLIAGALYPVLVVGLPFSAEYFARPLRLEPAFLLTIVAFAAALGLDWWYLGLTVVPVGLAMHRVTLLLSLGLIAAGAAYRSSGGPRWNVLRQIGIVGWVFALVLPVVGLV